MHDHSTPLVANGLRRLYELLKELTESDWFDTAFDATTDLAEEVVHNDAFGFMLVGGVLLTGFLVSEGFRHRRARRVSNESLIVAEPTKSSGAD